MRTGEYLFTDKQNYVLYSQYMAILGSKRVVHILIAATDNCKVVDRHAVTDT